MEFNLAMTLNCADFCLVGDLLSTCDSTITCPLVVRRVTK